MNGGLGEPIIFFLEIFDPKVQFGDLLIVVVRENAVFRPQSQWNDFHALRRRRHFVMIVCAL